MKVLKLVYRIIEENEEQNVFIKTLSLCITKPSLNSSKFTQELTALSFLEIGDSLIFMALNLQKSKTFFNFVFNKEIFYPIINALFEKQIIIICL